MLRFITGALVLALTVPALAEQPDHGAVMAATNPGMTTGIWSKIADRVAFEGTAHRVDLGGAGNRKPVRGAAWYSVSETLDLGLTANLEEDVKGYGIAVRFHFGK